MTITVLQPHLYPSSNGGRIAPPARTTAGTAAVGPDSGELRRAADTVEISPEAREMAASATDNRAKGVPSTVSSATSRATGDQNVGAVGAVECQTCKSRTYQDGSNDPTVSFQAATRIAPEAAESLVRSHEQEHVSHEQVKAKEKGSEVVSQNVSIQYQICPECGRSYVAGGTTKTVTRSAAGSGMGNSASGANGGKSVNVWA